MALAKQVHNERYGGISNDEYIATQKGAFSFGKGVDIRAASKSFRLSAGYVASSRLIPGNYPFCGYYGDPETGYGYTVGGLVVDLSSMAPIGSFGETTHNALACKDTSGAPFVFVAGYSKMHKHTPPSGITVNTGVYSPGTLAPKPTSKRPLLRSKGWYVYIGDVDGVLRYSIDTQVIDRPLILDTSDVVISIVELGDQLIIFTKNGSNGRQYFRDGVSKVPNRMIEWFANPCIFAAIFKNQIYVVTQNGFYVSDGYNSQLLYRSGTKLDFSGIPTASLYANYDTSLDIFYFAAAHSYAVPSFTTAVYSYGERLPGFGKSLIPFGNPWGPSLKNGYATNFQIYGDNIYYCADGGPGNVYYSKISGYVNSGYIETLPIIGDGLDVLKKTEKVRISYNLPDVTRTGVKIYVSYDDKPYVQLFETTIGNSVVGFNRRTIQETGQRFKRKLKIELTTTDPTLTPEFFQDSFLFTPIQDDFD